MRLLGWDITTVTEVLWKGECGYRDVYRRKTMSETPEKLAIYKPGEESWTHPSLTALRRNQPANTSILDFYLLEL